MHVIFCKKTREKQLTDTVFFKHKHIMQPTVTPAGAIVNAFTKLQDAIHGIQYSKDDAHFEARRRLEHTLQPPVKHAIKTVKHAKLPRVEQQIEHTQQVPRVCFNDAPPTVHDPPPQLIVASPRKQIIEPQPKPILKPLKYIDESIAVQVQSRRLQSQTTVNESIAKRVARWRQEAANAVLDQDTRQLLKYCRLLKHPCFKDVWNKLAADEFGRLAQGIGGRIKGTGTIQFIHKHKIPADRLRDVTYIKFVCTV
jgi:hypothetical protein